MAPTRTSSVTPLSPGLHRASFAKIREPLAAPDLLKLQTASFDWLLGGTEWQQVVREALASGNIEIPQASGLTEIFEEISPIEDFAGAMSLSFRDHRFEPPKYTVEQCKDKDFTYSAPLFVTAEFMNNETGEIKSQTVFMGDFPLMTNKGTFIINGTERVVVSQLVRSPGVYFDRSVDKATDKDVFACKIIPSRGAWLEFEIDKKDLVAVRVDRKRKQRLQRLRLVMCCFLKTFVLTPVKPARTQQNAALLQQNWPNLLMCLCPKVLVSCIVSRHPLLMLVHYFPTQPVASCTKKQRSLEACLPNPHALMSSSLVGQRSVTS